jgi:hypothetical protein
LVASTTANQPHPLKHYRVTPALPPSPVADSVYFVLTAAQRLQCWVTNDAGYARRLDGTSLIDTVNTVSALPDPNATDSPYMIIVRDEISAGRGPHYRTETAPGSGVYVWVQAGGGDVTTAAMNAAITAAINAEITARDAAIAAAIATEVTNRNTAIATAVSGLGTGSGSSGYVHTQSVAAVMWTVVHNLGGKPLVDILDTSGDQIGSPEITHLSDNSFTVSFVAPLAGLALCVRPAPASSAPTTPTGTWKQGP